MSPPFDPKAAGEAPAVGVAVDAAGELPTAAVDRIVGCFRGHVAESAGGMSFALYRNGTPLLRLHGGVTDRHGDQPWTESTLAVLFSGTKGIVATLAALLVDRGMLDPYARVTAYWPEFGAAGKADVRVHHVLAHTVGLVYVDPTPEGAESLDNDLMARRLEQQAPVWELGTRVGYHAITYGYLMTEILRRVTGRGMGELVRTELAEPHGLDLYLGLPESQEPRVATIFRADGYRIFTFLADDRVGDTPEKQRKRQEIIAAAWRLFGSHGYHDTSMAEIAHTCRVSPSIVNYYFTSKRSLFEECLRYCVRLSFERQAAQPHTESDPSQRLKQLIDLQLPAGAVRNEWSIWLQSWCAVTVGTGSRANHSRAYLRWYRAVRDVLQEGQEAGVFVDTPIDDLAVDLTSLFDGLAIKVLVGSLTVEAIRARLHGFVDRLAPAAYAHESSQAPSEGEEQR